MAHESIAPLLSILAASVVPTLGTVHGELGSTVLITSSITIEKGIPQRISRELHALGEIIVMVQNGSGRVVAL